MKYCSSVILLCMLFACAHQTVVSRPDEEQVREYSATAVSLSDFSMKIVAYYQSQNLPIPSDFDAGQFFALLERIYPDQSRVRSVRNSYRVTVRPEDGGYSVMLCDQQTGKKIMEDLSCRLDRVEIRSWEKETLAPCVFENDWKQYCK